MQVSECSMTRIVKLLGFWLDAVSCEGACLLGLRGGIGIALLGGTHKHVRGQNVNSTIYLGIGLRG
jgi:hypothetical protein